ncbi:hypothetical protein [Marinitoga lauensis]|uniref:hypothetical protein n=1 Tax=Marinitoga lauensis TaxID=2201189 RepID=UPI001010E9ED|nr:hypothetical protein [Marinitoga lauensis]
MIQLNNKVIDVIVLINIFIGGIISIILAIITWKLFTKKEKRKIIISLIIFFSIWALMGTGIAYMKRGRLPLDKSELFSGNVNTNVQNKTIDANYSGHQMNIFREIAASPRTAFIKLYQEIKWIFFIVSILLGITAVIFIRKFFINQEKEEKEIEKFSIDKLDYEDIPYLIEEGYKYIRKRFFRIFSYLTPYELLNKIQYPEEFKLLTNLFVLKEYGEKNYEYTEEEIKNIIKKSINFLKKIVVIK